MRRFHFKVGQEVFEGVEFATGHVVQDVEEGAKVFTTYHDFLCESAYNLKQVSQVIWLDNHPEI